MNINVLDKGFVRLVEGTKDGDMTVVRAARVSYGSGLKSTAEDRKLIKYLLEHEHGTPFEHNSFTFHVKCPIFVMRQWVRHRIGQSFNEVSGRYTEMKEEFYIPTKWRGQDTKNKQGSVDFTQLHDEYLSSVLESACEIAFRRYMEFIKMGVAREMARMVLPINLYTEFYWTVNARSLMAFIKLRSESHAQWEIQQYSSALAAIFAAVMPWTYDAFYYTRQAGYHLPHPDSGTVMK